MRHTGEVIDEAFLKEKADDVVHAVVLGLSCGCAVETGRRGTRLHDGADDAHDCLQAAKRDKLQLHF